MTIFCKNCKISILYGSDYINFLRYAILKARSSIHAMQFVIDARPSSDKMDHVRYLLHSMAEASNRGLGTKLMTPALGFSDNKIFDMNEAALFFLKNRGVSVKRILPDNMQIHSKSILIDDYLLIMGSHNWTHSAFNLNSETSVAIFSKEFSKVYYEMYEDIWKTGIEV